jgi:LCP family protein required for cell wall assembly
VPAFESAGVFPSLPATNATATIAAMARPLTVLILGIDHNGAGQSLTTSGDRTRTDTMLLVRIDPGARRLSVLSIPRDTRVRIPGHGNDKINAANVFGGLPLVRETIQEFLGMPVDRVVRVNLAAAEAILTAIGGVEMDVERAFDYDDHAGRLHVHLQPGRQTLSPRDAVAYARFRKDGQGDIGRIARQQRLLHAVTDQLCRPANLLRLPTLVDIVRRHVESDVTAGEWAQLLVTVPAVWGQDVRWGTLPGRAAVVHGGWYWLPDPQQNEVLLAKLFGEDTGDQAREHPSVVVIDAQPDPSVAAAVTADLEGLGFTVRQAQKGRPDQYPSTQVIDQSQEGHSAHLQQLRSLIRPEQTRMAPADPQQRSSDYVVVLGPHYQRPAPAITGGTATQP